jgi:hypothetical protein
VSVVSSAVASLALSSTELTNSTTDLTSRTSQLANATATLASLVSAVLSDPWRYISTCALTRAPQTLSVAFKTFTSFARNSNTYMVGAADGFVALFKWNRVLSSMVVLQTIDFGFKTRAAASISNGGYDFVAVAFLATSGLTTDAYCTIYRFSPTSESLSPLQNVSSVGSTGATFVVIEAKLYLMVSANRNGTSGSYSAMSTIYNYNVSTSLFDYTQQIPTSSAQPPESFYINDTCLLAVPNFYDGSTHTLLSKIYQFNSTTLVFDLKQLILTDGATHMKPWVFHSTVYLAVVNSFGMYADVYTYNTNSGLFEAQSHVNVAQGVQGCDLTTIRDSMYLALTPNPGSVVLLYKFNEQSKSFSSLQNITLPVSNIWLYPSFLPIFGDTYLAVADSIFKFCDDSFVLST